MVRDGKCEDIITPLTPGRFICVKCDRRASTIKGWKIDDSSISVEDGNPGCKVVDTMVSCSEVKCAHVQIDQSQTRENHSQSSEDIKHDLLAFGDSYNLLTRSFSWLSTSDETNPHSFSSGEFLPSQERKDLVQTLLRTLNLSPIKLQGLPADNKVNLAKRKLDEIRSESEKNLKRMFKLGDDENLSATNDVYDKIVADLQAKFEKTTYAGKIQILTLFVDHLAVIDIQKMFNTTKYSIWKAAEVKEKQGVLGLPEPRTGRKLFVDLESRVIDFFCNPIFKHVRMTAGKKDCVSVSKGVYEQKRLLLSNLREIYESYKAHYPNDKVGFSKFCSLRPKFCKLPGASGTHSVCVCFYHQNIKLLLYAIDPKLNYRDVLSEIVCDVNDCECMTGECLTCKKDEDEMKTCLHGAIFSSSVIDPDDEITYKQWTQTDRSDLLTHISTFGEFFELLAEKFKNLLPHHYIARKQCDFLKERKINLDAKTAVVQVDFSENHSFVIQDEVQSHYWTKKSCTVHPVIIYIKSDDLLEHKTLCFLSDDLNHDVTSVITFQKHIVNYIKETYPRIENIEYWSDGCAEQYKNCQNFLFLCLHEKVFGLKSTWKFFATAHGKSACDGVGGIVKRDAAIESLKRPYENQILNVEDLFEYLTGKFKEMKIVLVLKEEIDANRRQFASPVTQSSDPWSSSFNLATAQTIPGTRGYHDFTPLNEEVIACKITSYHSSSFKFNIIKKKTYDWKSTTYVSFVHNNQWKIGFIVDLNDEDLEVSISLLEHERSNIYKWPRNKRILFIPFDHVLQAIQVENHIDGFKVKLGHTKSKFGKFLKEQCI